MQRLVPQPDQLGQPAWYQDPQEMPVRSEVCGAGPRGEQTLCVLL